MTGMNISIKHRWHQQQHAELEFVPSEETYCPKQILKTQLQTCPSSPVVYGPWMKGLFFSRLEI